MPSSPSAAAFSARASVSIEKTTSAPAAASRGVSAERMPASTSGSAFARVLFQPVTSRSAARSRRTMPLPIAPRPTNATRIAREPKRLLVAAERVAERELRGVHLLLDVDEGRVVGGGLRGVHLLPAVDGGGVGGVVVRQPGAGPHPVRRDARANRRQPVAGAVPRRPIASGIAGIRRVRVEAVAEAAAGGMRQ